MTAVSPKFQPVEQVIGFDKDTQGWCITYTGFNISTVITLWSL